MSKSIKESWLCPGEYRNVSEAVRAINYHISRVADHYQFAELGLEACTGKSGQSLVRLVPKAQAQGEGKDEFSSLFASVLLKEYEKRRRLHQESQVTLNA